MRSVNWRSTSLILTLPNLQHKSTDCRNHIENISVKRLTHINYAFAFLNDDYSIKLTDDEDLKHLAALAKLRSRNPTIKIVLSIGGSSMNAPDSSYKHILSSMVKTRHNRAAFIIHALSFLQAHRLDGIEIDWEYPGDRELGVNSWDLEGLIALASEFRAAVTATRRSVLFTVAIPASSRKWDSINVTAMAPYVDYFNVMSYDFLGSWSNHTGYHSPWDDPTFGAPDALTALQHYITERHIPPSQLNLGLAAYGRSWTLRYPLLPKNGSSYAVQARGPGRAGECSGEVGVLAWRDIKSILDAGTYDWVFEDRSNVKSSFMIVGDQHISFDLPQSLDLKQQAALQMGIGGFSLWNSHLDDPRWTMTKQLGSPSNPASIMVPGYKRARNRKGMRETWRGQLMPVDPRWLVNYG